MYAFEMVTTGKGILAADEAITNMGGFTDIGVENIEPKVPPLVIVKVPPVKSSIVSVFD